MCCLTRCYEARCGWVRLGDRGRWLPVRFRQVFGIRSAVGSSLSAPWPGSRPSSAKWPPPPATTPTPARSPSEPSEPGSSAARTRPGRQLSVAAYDNAATPQATASLRSRPASRPPPGCWILPVWSSRSASARIARCSRPPPRTGRCGSGTWPRPGIPSRSRRPVTAAVHDRAQSRRRILAEAGAGPC